MITEITIKAIIQPIIASTKPNPPPKNIIIHVPTFVTKSDIENPVVARKVASLADVVLIKSAFAGNVKAIPAIAPATEPIATLYLCTNVFILANIKI